MLNFKLIGKFEEVLDVANEFKKYAPEKGDDVRELDEYAAHMYAFFSSWYYVVDVFLLIPCC